MLVVVMAIAGIIALMVPSLYFIQLEATKQQVKRGEYEMYHDMLRSLRAQIEDPNNCHNILSGVVLPASIKGKTTGVTLNWKYLTDPLVPKTLLNVGPGYTLPYTEIVMDDVEILRTSDILSTHQVKLSGVLRTMSMVSFRVYVRPKNLSVNLGPLKLPSGALAPNQRPENVPPMVRSELAIRLLANIDSSRKIFNCFGHDSIAGICQAVGGVYNHFGPFDLKCQPDTACFPGNPVVAFSPSECTSQGSVIKYKSVEVGENEDGKTFYMCMLCKGDLP